MRKQPASAVFAPAVFILAVFSLAAFVLAAFVLSAFVLVTSVPAAMADAQKSDPDQIACEPDVHRLCEDVFPDVELVATCLVTKRQQLSTPCATALAHPTADAPETK